MEYWQKLDKLAVSEQALVAAANMFSSQIPTTLEKYKKILEAVHVLEVKLQVVRHWTPDDPEWQCAGRLVAMQKYQRALDRLEGLVVACMFELTKMNCSQTALNNYNTTAKALRPPCPTPDRKQVVEYAFLADFDLLWDAWQDITNAYMCACGDQVRATNLPLALQIGIHQMERGCFNKYHVSRLLKILQLPGFTGTICPGESVDIRPRESASKASAHTPLVTTAIDSQEGLEDEEEDKEDAIEISSAFERIVHISGDS
ncbi:hypothetical protein SERLADRAFT_406236 [Serpula lacrymans var. lacrymans S7.9]|uniref:Uncharacterized protein n=1 Tax=Serpula lacrymans var. lacrymans (strain S7.9) TaxID=578457 RepID=F8NKY5_SERL9|nr:uncharacterized protein SERLADRAFT_406236 [Serpula lacrymans var. lacrymans S7.9]EGO28854.1 hypothetical protein SERLADRAFT_406236 [Serpula lacrymans var. lacrymans S7.9]